MNLKDNFSSRIVEDRADGVMIAISALDLVDSLIGRMISYISAMAKIRDAHTVLVRRQPAVTITLVELELKLRGVKTALNVEHGTWSRFLLARKANAHLRRLR